MLSIALSLRFLNTIFRAPGFVDVAAAAAAVVVFVGALVGSSDFGIFAIPLIVSALPSKRRLRSLSLAVSGSSFSVSVTRLRSRSACRCFFFSSLPTFSAASTGPSAPLRSLWREDFFAFFSFLCFFLEPPLLIRSSGISAANTWNSSPRISLDDFWTPLSSPPAAGERYVPLSASRLGDEGGVIFSCLMVMPSKAVDKAAFGESLAAADCEDAPSWTMTQTGRVEEARRVRSTLCVGFLVNTLCAALGWQSAKRLFTSDLRCVWGHFWGANYYESTVISRALWAERVMRGGVEDQSTLHFLLL